MLLLILFLIAILLDAYSVWLSFHFGCLFHSVIFYFWLYPSIWLSIIFDYLFHLIIHFTLLFITFGLKDDYKTANLNVSNEIPSTVLLQNIISSLTYQGSSLKPYILLRIKELHEAIRIMLHLILITKLKFTHLSFYIFK